MSVVAFGSSITAGPSMRWPPASDGRQTMRVRMGRAGSANATTLIHPGDVATVFDAGHLVIDVALS